MAGRCSCPVASETRSGTDEPVGDDVDAEPDCAVARVYVVEDIDVDEDGKMVETDGGLMDAALPLIEEVPVSEEIVILAVVCCEDNAGELSEYEVVLEGGVEEASVDGELVCVEEGRRVTPPGSRQSVMFMPCGFVIVRL